MLQIVQLGIEGGGATVYGRQVNGVWSFWQKACSMDLDEHDDEYWRHWSHPPVADLAQALPKIWPLMYPVEIHESFRDWFRQRYAEQCRSLTPHEQRIQAGRRHKQWQEILDDQER